MVVKPRLNHLLDNTGQPINLEMKQPETNLDIFKGATITTWVVHICMSCKIINT